MKVIILRLFFVTSLSIFLLFANFGCTVETFNSVDNNTPIANAGNDQNVSIYSQVTLDGSSSSDEDGDVLSYVWTFTDMPTGSTAVLFQDMTVRPTFIADAAGTYTLSLVVNDGTDDSAADTVIVTASGTNSAPVADAGPGQNVSINSTVTLNGSGSSDADLDSLTYSWSMITKPAYSMATLSDTTAVHPTFNADREGYYVVRLVVYDGMDYSVADTVIITASGTNSTPVADAGPDQNVSINATVTLNGSGSSDADLDSLTYSWSMTSLPANSTATLSSTTAVRPSFVADREGFYVLRLTVNDGTVNSVADTVTITASVANSAPVADAGPDQNVSIYSTVTLNGSGSSDVDQDSLTYSWSMITAPAGSMATLSSTTAVRPTFVADYEGDYVLRLIVNDGTVNSVADTVTISVSGANSAPVADAGPDQNVSVNATVTLNGSRSSDADLDSLTYSWSMTTVPANSTATLSSTTAERPTFVADRAGYYVLRLIVNDGTVNSAADTVTITASVAIPENINVLAVAETTPVPDSGDAADDPAIWVHPTDPSLSVIIGTNKLDGIAVYNLDGSQRQYISSGKMNNVDIRYGFSLGADTVDLVGMSNRTNDTLTFYKMDPVTRQISSAGSVNTSLTVYGFCMYKSGVDGAFYAFVNDKNGNVRQYELFDNSGTVGGTLVRSFNVGSITEGCVADDDYGDFYIGEEDVSIWKYGAEPGTGSARSELDSVGSHLTADIEGLTIYYAAGGQGYLIASSQGSSEFVIYDRVTGAYVGTFKIVAGNGIDTVTGTDGIDVISTPLGPNFPYGMFIAQDTDNSGYNQNYKFVKWEDIAQGFTINLMMDTSWNPRN